MADPNDISWAKDAVPLATSATAFEPCRAIFVEVAGSATVTTTAGNSRAFTALPVGVLTLGITKFTAGTATIWALY